MNGAATDFNARAQRFPSALIDRLRLADGREVVVRPVLALDAPAEQAFVRTLSANSRLRRFHFGLGRVLMARLACHAERHGVRRMVGDVLPGNAPSSRSPRAWAAASKPRPTARASFRCASN